MSERVLRRARLALPPITLDVRKQKLSFLLRRCLHIMLCSTICDINRTSAVQLVVQCRDSRAKNAKAKSVHYGNARV